ncbi:RNA polymerase sigma factor [Sphingobacterium humi]|uniref:RNA polymerase sigma-70 factor n=1 Tax=Sphingobacterium humi TaxID=1796905 RepID=A0A6N8L328_9SPHI|nr:RNA polymerase sigma-70 factor [Sphingobacterium humi]MVZ63439.1 RNA polymerase sigma-70 factor [Sphingobacterium humi]
MQNKEAHSYLQLLDAISHGDERAFSTFYDIFASDLIKHILSKVQDQQIAEDILHDLFLSLWKNRERLPQIQSVPAYLYSSCRYLILAYYRKQQQENIQSLDLTNLDVIDEEITIEDRLYYRYTLDLIANEIEKLPEKCREVFRMSRFEFLSNKEIAEKLQISESTVEKHINKAISRLRIASKAFTLIF